MIFGTAFESDLKLAPQVLIELIAHQVVKQGVCVWPNVESFGRGSASSITGSDVANGIATSFASGDAGLGQESEERVSLIQFDIIDLRVLTSGEVNEAAPEAIGGIGQSDQLIGRQDSARNFDALHLHTLLALCVGSEVQSHLLQFCLIKPTGAIFLNLLLILVQLVTHKVRHGTQKMKTHQKLLLQPLLH